MKRKKEIFLFALGFLFIIGGIVCSMVMNEKESLNSKNEDETISVDASYTCELKEKNFEDENGSIITATESYNFSYNNGEILYASIITNYKFLNLDSYHNFVWSDKNSSSSPNSVTENEETLEKQYKWLITIQKEKDTGDIQDYIKQLNDMGYMCKEK